jgi:hypothetical protein
LPANQNGEAQAEANEPAAPPAPAADLAAPQVEEACRRFDTQTTGKSVFLS